MTREKWRPVPGYEGLYEASTHGRVRSLDRIVQRRGHESAVMKIKGVELKPELNKQNGYLYVNLCRDGSKAHLTVHVIVAMAFLSLGPGQVVDHKNQKTTQNRVSNLRVASRSQNAHNQHRSLQQRKGANLNNRWRARLRHEGKDIHIGYFDTEEEAKQAYVETARRLHGEFANDKGDA